MTAGSLTAFGEAAVAPFTPTTGWSFAYNVNADMVATTTVDGTVTHDDNQAILSTGAAANQSAKIATRRTVRYIPGQGARTRFTAVFSAGAAGSTQIIGVGDAEDGLFFGYNGAAFGIMRRRAGEDTWTPATAWNNRRESSMGRRLDPTKGNVYQIAWQWLGFGAIQFFIEEPNSGLFELVHTIRYANTATETSLQSPDLPIMAQVANVANATDITLGTPSAVGGIDGELFEPGALHPFSFFRTAVATKAAITTEQAVLTLKNAATFATLTNKIRLRPVALSVASDGTKNTTIRLVKNTVLGGTPSYTDYNENTSPASYDAAGTTLTGGTVIASLALAKVDSRPLDLASLGIDLAPGETLTISATSSGATEVSAAITWADLF